MRCWLQNNPRQPVVACSFHANLYLAFTGGDNARGEKTRRLCAMFDEFALKAAQILQLLGGQFTVFAALELP